MLLNKSRRTLPAIAYTLAVVLCTSSQGASPFDFNKNETEKLAAVKSANAFINAYSVDRSKAAIDRAREKRLRGYKHCSIIKINWAAFNSESPLQYLRLPGPGKSEFVAEFVSNNPSVTGNTTWIGQVLSTNGGRVFFSFDARSKLLGGNVLLFDENQWTITTVEDEFFLCQEGDSNLQSDIVEVEDRARKQE